MKSGRTLTPELIEKLQAEAEAGYDPSTLRRVRRPGRPARGEPAGETRRVSLRLSPYQYAALKSHAEREGKSISAVIRERLPIPRPLAKGANRRRGRTGRTPG